MILQDNWNARDQRSKRKHILMKAKPVHMTDIRGESA
jgi:hypothetical protein